MKYQIKGGNLPVVICQLAENESIVCEGGAMSWMSENLEMSTTSGGFKKGFGRFKIRIRQRVVLVLSPWHHHFRGPSTLSKLRRIVR